ncbi:type III polyketide synthase [Bacillus weihaiensis]|uniref:Chalcone synthase n=1 Tax=Bacillus weihaiensis TaxID=1547283 RepID=A0A1L3MQN1_9BACI|nr:3-oxoacyl-[acyl-carrier-protein] synthase III C-terminal domain-containing protein [Bacillus weihaiensis]APH04665.1 chalcone synthase [Bacillus weihaiensis]
MAYIVSVGKTVPEVELKQEVTVDFAKEIFKDSFKDLDRLLTVFKNGEIETRQFPKDVQWYKQTHTFGEKNDLYIEKAVEYGTQAVMKCLTNNKLLNHEVLCEEIDAIFFISSTGISTPSIDAKMMNLLPFKSTTKRIPIWGLGCAGGASGMARAYEYCKAFKKAKVLVVSVELCSLTFQHDDTSKSNLIGTSIFADGVACTLIVGEEVDVASLSKMTCVPQIVDTRSNLMEDSEDVMGWDIRDNGLYVVFSRNIPSIIKSWLKPQAHQFLQEHQLTLKQIRHFVAHPGGKKVLDAYKEGLGFTDEHLEISKEILIKHGNMSSVTVMYVLEKYLERSIGQVNEYGLIGALGPGFSSEMLLIKWKEAY